MNTTRGKQLLDKHLDIFVSRIGSYIGEVIKEQSNHNHFWYEYKTVYKHTTKLDDYGPSIENQDVLYDKSRDTVIMPLQEVRLFLKGDSNYSRLSAYVEDMVNQSK
jgi:hypothetical protein